MTFEVHSNYYFPEQWGNVPGTVPIYIDDWIMKADKRGIALLVEPRSICPGVYEYIKSHHNDFDIVFTHDEEIYAELPNTKLLLYGAITVAASWGKTKGISMICSKKELCEGHKARKMVANALKGKISTFGEFDGGPWVDHLEEIYQPFMFNVAMENYRGGFYFTEKILNCFATYTVPIYYGSPLIGNLFDRDGIIIARTPEDVIQRTEELLSKDIKSEYEKRKGAIAENYRRAQLFKDWRVLFLANYGKVLEEVYGQ